MASSQRRCVFVGNIPYDATEEQLIQICEEVGPVVSFRLVIDRETGKPKGYGFCEYKDEETALSARRNLQGYEINGRQLRVDFAENDKNSDRNREQGRGGPGMSSDSQKQVAGGPAVLGDSVQHQPIGLHSAITAAAVVAGTLGTSQGMKQNQNGLPAQTALVNDPLTLHLAKLSRSQLTDVMSELKMMATNNLESARKLLLAKPQLSKAIFQAEMMLGLVTPQMLQMLSARQASGQLSQPSFQDEPQIQLPAAQNLPGQHALPQSMMQSGMVPKFPEGRVSSVPLSSIQNQGFASQQSPMRPRVPISQDANIRAFHPSLPPNSGVSNLPSVQLPSSANLSVRPPIPLANPVSLNQQIRPPLQQQGGSAVANLGHNTHSVVSNAAIRTSMLPHTLLADTGSQRGPRTSSSIQEPSRPNQVAEGASWAGRSSAVSDQASRPSKLLKMEDGSGTPFPAGNLNVFNTTGSGSSQVPGVGTLPHTANRTEMQTSDSQSQIAPEVESVLLQQVLNLTPEQLSLLPEEQQQQVIQLQQALRRGEFQP